MNALFLITVVSLASAYPYEAVDEVAVNEVAASDEVTANETAAGETAPNETAPNETAPNETAPNETAPNETAPGETAAGETAAGATTSNETAPNALAATTSQSTDQPVGCEAIANSSGMGVGPAALGYGEGDMTTGRRACPRTEVGLGARFGAIIDTPDFYGAVSVNGVVYGSWAVRPTTELFASLEAVTFNYAVNAVLQATQLTLGHFTVGGTQVLFQSPKFVGSVTGRVLLPTSFEIPGARLLGGELGANALWRPISWLEVHGYLGGELTGALGRAAGIPRGGGTLIAGVTLQPFTWGALVIDLTGRLGPLSFFAPTAAFRFAIGKLGIELAATRPLVGTDRHTVIGGLRVNYRLD